MSLTWKSPSTVRFWIIFMLWILFWPQYSTCNWLSPANANTKSFWNPSKMICFGYLYGYVLLLFLSPFLRLKLVLKPFRIFHRENYFTIRKNECCHLKYQKFCHLNRKCESWFVYIPYIYISNSLPFPKKIRSLGARISGKICFYDDPVQLH